MKLPRQPLLKLQQSVAFARLSRTPAPLIRDIFRLQRPAYLAVASDGTAMRLLPLRGEYFFFFDNVLRRDCLQGGLALRPGDTVLDVGANIGSFTVVAARLVGPEGSVFAFEPDPKAFDRLRENVEVNKLTNVRCLPYAIGGRRGSFEFFSHDRPNFSSLFGGVDRRGMDGMTATTAEVRTLADAVAELGLARIDLLKLDCEGAEYEIFETIDPDLAGLVAQLAMETHAVPGRSRRALIDRLVELGFSPRGRGVPAALAAPGGRPALLDPHPSRPLPPEVAEAPPAPPVLEAAARP